MNQTNRRDPFPYGEARLARRGDRREIVRSASHIHKRLDNTRKKRRPSRMQDISCLVLPIPAHAFFKQAVLQGEIGHDLLQSRMAHGEGLSLRRGVRRGPYRPPIGVYRPPASPWTSRNTSRRRCPRGGKSQRCSLHRAALPVRCGSSFPLNTAGGSDAGCPSALVLPALCPARISVSSSLLAATMNQKSSLRKVPQFVSGVLTADNLAADVFQPYQDAHHKLNISVRLPFPYAAEIAFPRRLPQATPGRELLASSLSGCG